MALVSRSFCSHCLRMSIRLSQTESWDRQLENMLKLRSFSDSESGKRIFIKMAFVSRIPSWAKSKRKKVTFKVLL